MHKNYSLRSVIWKIYLLLYRTVKSAHTRISDPLIVTRTKLSQFFNYSSKIISLVGTMTKVLRSLLKQYYNILQNTTPNLAIVQLWQDFQNGEKYDVPVHSRCLQY